MMVFACSAIILCVVMGALYWAIKWLSPPFGTKSTPFECGFESMSTMRRPFSIRYFILVLLFLVFDVETVLLFPLLTINILSGMSIILSNSLYMLAMMLLVGLLYEWSNNMLDWVTT